MHSQSVAPALKAWLERYNQLMARSIAKGFVPTAENARDGLARLTRVMVGPGPDLPLVRDAVVDGPDYSVPVRIYHPEPTLALPVLVYFHGGGHVVGSVAVFDPICRNIAASTRYVVVAVDYRLAPEHPYPAGLDDARTVVSGAFAMLSRLGINFRRRMAIAGDSAGGAMGATLAHTLVRPNEQDITHLVLIYPGLDYTMSQPSWEQMGVGYMIERKRIEWFYSQYFAQNEERKMVSPLYMAVPENFPQTLIVTAGFCPSRDEAEIYVEILKKSRVAVQHLHCGDMIHAFLNLENLVPERCAWVYQQMAEFLGKGKQ